MATPLCDALRKYVDRCRCSYHTPGHKGQAAFLQPLTALTWDLTELPETGSLYDGGDAIEQAETETAAAFGVANSFFSAGGCTLCIQTMLALAAERGRTVLMGRNAHRSAVHAAALLDLAVVWSVDMTPQAVESALCAMPTIKTVYVTSPDYYGRLADIRGLSAVCRRYGAALAVDNAHGTHLKAFGLHPLELGADITADSAHKTLPVLTGGAYLHIAANGVFADVSRERVKSLMGLFGSTSPAFPVLASLDAAQHWFQTEGTAAFIALKKRLHPVKAVMRQKHLMPPFEAIDPVRLTLDCGDRAAAAADWLREKAIEIEYSDERYVVLLPSPFHSDEQLSYLCEVLGSMELSAFSATSPSPFSANMPDTLPERAVSLREAILAKKEAVPCERASGRISAQTVCPCPPGVAVIVPGEVIGDVLAAQLASTGMKEIHVLK